MRRPVEAHGRHARALLFAAAAAATAACTHGNPINVTDLPTARTSQGSYAIPAGAAEIQIPVTFTNSSGAVLYLDGAGRDLQVVEKLVDGTWRVAYHPVYTMQAAEPLPLANGESRQMNVSLNLQPGVEPQLREKPPGTYRLVFGYGQGTERVLRTVRSNEFQLVVSN